jgi:hypothetical protein
MQKMKRTQLLFLLAVIALPLAGCKNSSPVNYEINANLSAVDDNTSQVVLASVIENLANIRKDDYSYETNVDMSKVYFGALAPLSWASSESTVKTLKIYDNQIAVSKTDTTWKDKTYHGAEMTAVNGIVSSFWLDSYTPKDTTDTSNYALYARSETTIGGAMERISGYTNPYKGTSDQLANNFSVFVLSSLVSNYASVFKSSESSSVFRNGDDYVFYSESSSTGTLSDPSHPSDTTKEIGTVSQHKTYATLKKRTGAEGYFLTEMKIYSDSYALGKFGTDEIPEKPINFGSGLADILFSYESQGQGTHPEPYVDTDQKKIPELMVISNLGTTNSTASLGDVTAAYKKEHPETTAENVYFTSLYLSSGVYYSFGFENTEGTLVATDGYRAVTSRFNTISEVTDHPEYFTATPGYYSIYAFVDAKGAATYQVLFTYRESAIIIR